MFEGAAIASRSLIRGWVQLFCECLNALKTFIWRGSAPETHKLSHTDNSDVLPVVQLYSFSVKHSLQPPTVFLWWIFYIKLLQGKNKHGMLISCCPDSITPTGYTCLSLRRRYLTGTVCSMEKKKKKALVSDSASCHLNTPFPTASTSFQVRRAAGLQME